MKEVPVPLLCSHTPVPESPTTSQSKPGIEDRRQHLRAQLAVAVQLCPEGGGVPIRTETSDLSMGGCYVEMAFPFDVGVILDINMWVGESKLIVKGKVVTRHPQFGNGIEFLQLPAASKAGLQALLNSAPCLDMATMGCRKT